MSFILVGYGVGAAWAPMARDFLEADEDRIQLEVMLSAANGERDEARRVADQCVAQRNRLVSEIDSWQDWNARARDDIQALQGRLSDANGIIFGLRSQLASPIATGALPSVKPPPAVVKPRLTPRPKPRPAPKKRQHIDPWCAALFGATACRTS